jgi:hypothetical protein
VTLPLLRFSQVRRTERVNAPATEEAMALGRYFQADCQAGDVVGNFVYVTGAGVLGVPQVTKVDVLTTGKYPGVGMIIEKSTATRCVVQGWGEIAVSPAILVPGKVYWIGTDSNLASTPPMAGPGGKAAVQPVGVALDAGRFLVNAHPTLFLRAGS